MSITKYKNLSNSSNVDWFEIGEEFLRVKFFNTSKIYQYSYSNTYLMVSKVKKCKRTYNIYPSIVVGTLAHIGQISYSNQNRYRENILDLIQGKYKVG